MPFKPESKYPNRRAYVLKLHCDATPEGLMGVLENLVTGEQRKFACGSELVDAIASDLRTSDEHPRSPAAT